MCKLNDKEKELLNYIFDEFAYNHFDDITFDSEDNPISFYGDNPRLNQFKLMQSIVEKLSLN